MKILVINGPNLNMLGIREVEIYGNKTYADLLNLIKSYCKKKDIFVEFFQSNYEGAIIDKIQDAYKKFDGIIINAGGLTHTSISILDAIKLVNIRTVEVHISDIAKREDFRKKSLLSDVCIKTIMGRGFDGYIDAIKILEENI